jgi:Tol biopolymer transport system component
MWTDALPVLTRSEKVAILSIAVAISAGACTDPVGEPIEQGPRANGAIVFVAGPLPDYYPVQLFSMQEDGTQLRQLTDDINYKTAVATSPDGSRIAYAASDKAVTEESPEPEPSSIFVIDADGGGRKELCEACARTAYTFEPEPSDDVVDGPELYPVHNPLAWSPTASTLAVPAPTPGVVLIDIATGQTTTIPTPEPITAIAWSPDGNRLVLSHTWFMGEHTSLGILVPPEGTQVEREPEQRPGGIYLLEVGTSDVHEVVATPGLAHVHGWSSDGDRIAFTQVLDRSHTGEIAVYSVSEDRTWTVIPGELGGAPIGVGWSPSDDSIAALIDQHDEDSQTGKDLWVTPAGEPDLRALPLCSFDGAFDGDNCVRGSLVWSPDGTTVAYRAMLHGTPARSAVILQAVDDSFTDVALLDGASFDAGGEACCLAWLPAA